ncbi:MAG: cytidine deaminase [Muribaculaceae bacterium]|nr:cytidine deaminase [Muribaculaceae bacterium]MDE6330707.1 cytidine deaminase [Muribaculaceae bacterium]
MKDKEIVIRMKSCGLDELSEQDRHLVECAKNATRNSLATYSHFHVGAAILMDNGEIVEGANQENAAFSSGTCAERSACFYASARYPGVPMKKIAIAAWTKEGKPEGLDYEDYFQTAPISPCGACRQALLEYEAMYGPIEVLLYGRDEVLVLPSVASLLPFCFTEF